jgi:hypothetical protein
MFKKLLSRILQAWHGVTAGGSSYCHRVCSCAWGLPELKMTVGTGAAVLVPGCVWQCGSLATMLLSPGLGFLSCGVLHCNGQAPVTGHPVEQVCASSSWMFWPVWGCLGGAHGERQCCNNRPCVDVHGSSLLRRTSCFAWQIYSGSTQMVEVPGGG